MKKKTAGVVVLVWLCWVSGVTPEMLCAMPVPSSEETAGGMKAECGGTRGTPAAYAGGIAAAEACRVLGRTEAAVYADPRVARVGGGYYGSVGTNQYSGFFGNIENFLVELVEFFLFLAMLSYIVGYEEWLPWEKDKQ